MQYYRTVLTQKLLPSFWSDPGYGIRDRDPRSGSGKNLFLIPVLGPGVKKAPDPDAFLSCGRVGGPIKTTEKSMDSSSIIFCALLNKKPLEFKGQQSLHEMRKIVGTIPRFPQFRLLLLKKQSNRITGIAWLSDLCFQTSLHVPYASCKLVAFVC